MSPFVGCDVIFPCSERRDRRTIYSTDIAPVEEEVVTIRPGGPLIQVYRSIVSEGLWDVSVQIGVRVDPGFC